MAVSNSTRTHVVYQFIILTLLFLSIGYNELLPDRKFIFLAFLPIFCYQIVILSCCLELIPVPQWMSFLESPRKESQPTVEKLNNDSKADSRSNLDLYLAEDKQSLTFPDISEISCQRRWQKSVTDLGVTSKSLTYPPKAKSWMSLNDSKSTEGLLSREGSLDVLAPLSDRKGSLRISSKADKSRNREERAAKARSWKPQETSFSIPTKSERVKSTSMSMEPAEQPLSKCKAMSQEESEFSKSYSFPFRQKRLDSWLELKETDVKDSNQSLDMPYWQTVGYNLAVKYEARRRRRASKSDQKGGFVHIDEKPIETSLESSHTDRQSFKKNTKAATACINKIKVGFSNLISKKKDELPENNLNSNKIAKPSLLLKLKNKNISCAGKDKEKPLSIPEFPQFLKDDRPLIFYPKYIPFEKDRFEKDVSKKMEELSDEYKTGSS